MFGDLEALIFHNLEICSYSRIVKLYEKKCINMNFLVPMVSKDVFKCFKWVVCCSKVYLKTDIYNFFNFFIFNNVHKESNFQSLVCLFSIHKEANFRCEISHNCFWLENLKIIEKSVNSPCLHPVFGPPFTP